MALSFPTALTVAKGGKITSAQMRSLARALNRRTESGIGDMAWRKAQFWFNLFRLVRNPDSTGLVFPPMGEFFEILQHLDPRVPPMHEFQWPQQEPGDFEGANLANPMMQFVYGLAPYLDSEEYRLSEGFNDETGLPQGLPLYVGGFPGHPPGTPSEAWELGKAQRGAIDPVNGVQNVPALEAAQSFFQITTPYYSPHGKSYGGYFPSAVKLADDCGTTEETGLGIASWQVKFTNLTTGEVVIYDGSCPLDSEDVAANHVVGMARFPFATYVAIADGTGGYTVRRFDAAEWIEGPYEGEGVLQRTDGGQLQRAIWKFGTDFRGTAAQRSEEDFNIQEVAFDFQDFSTKQYHLSPNIGVISGDSIEALYPRAQLTGATTFAADTLFNFTQGSAAQHHEYREGYTMSAYHIKATGLVAPVTVEVSNSGSPIISTITLEPDSSGNADRIVTNLNNTNDLGIIAVIRLVTPAQFTSTSGSIIWEANEVASYKPHWWDFYLLFRMARTDGGDIFQSGVDGSGVDCDVSKDLFESYAESACIINTRGAAGIRMTPEWVNDNPIFDAARRMTREHMRVLSRRQFHSYEVAGGKSILRFFRYVKDVPTIPPGTLDTLEGIAPRATFVPSGEIKAGEEYIVRATSGGIDWKGAVYTNGLKFTGDGIHTEFIATGDALVYVYNGIKSVAIPNGWTNEWVMFMEQKGYTVSESSIWKPDAYADFYTFHNRCHFQSSTASNTNFRRHVTYNQRVTLVEDDPAEPSRYIPGLMPPRAAADFPVVEAPSGYNYAHGANRPGFITSDQQIAFYKSCPIYKAPYKVESAVIEITNGYEIVKLTFTDRFQHHEDAPATVNPDPTTWSSGEIADLIAEDARTDDNALREYALHKSTAHNALAYKMGDGAADMLWTSDPDMAWGAIYPHFFFVKLIPEPYEDGNTSLEPHDTRAIIDTLLQAEVTIRAGCEGFVDGQTSIDVSCASGVGNLYDYRFENLCFDAFGGKYIGAFSLVARPDNPTGFGPLPNTLMYAEVFNRLATCANLLTKARVMLPFTVECNSRFYEGRKGVDDNFFGGSICSPDGAYKMRYSGCPAAASTFISETGYLDCGGGAGASQSASIFTGDCHTDGKYLLLSQKTETDYRVAIDPNVIEAIPVSWRDQIISIGGFIAIEEKSQLAPTEEIVTTSLESDGCCEAADEPCPGFFWDGTSQGIKRGTEVVGYSFRCVAFEAGTLRAEPPPCGSFTAGQTVTDPPVRCSTSSQSSISLTVLTEAGFYVSIPLVASE